MARIVEHVPTPVGAATVFAYLADFTNTREWDPQIEASRRLDDAPIGLGSAFEVALRIGSRTIPLTYTITEYVPDTRVVLDTSGWWFRGRDAVDVLRLADGTTRVTWDATFALRGPLRLLDPLLAIGFRRIAQEAVAGLAVAVRALDAGSSTGPGGPS
jgi:hypothetical protein